MSLSDYFYQSEDHRILQTCPTLVFQESYSTAYGTTTFQIQPTMTLTCSSTRTFTVQLATISDAGIPTFQRAPASAIERAFTFVSGSNYIKVNDWSKLGNNNYYNLSLTLVVADSTGVTVTLTDYFFLVIGAVNVSRVQFLDNIDYLLTYGPQNLLLQ